MSTSQSKWDRYGPMTYLFIIGVSIGFELGFAFGIAGGAETFYIVLIPIAVILIAFVLFSVTARGIGKREARDK